MGQFGKREPEGPGWYPDPENPAWSRWWTGSEWDDPPAMSVSDLDRSGGVVPPGEPPSHRGSDGPKPKRQKRRAVLALLLVLIVALTASVIGSAEEDLSDDPEYRELLRASSICRDWYFLKLESDVLSYQEFRGELQEIHESRDRELFWYTDVGTHLRAVLAGLTHRNQGEYDEATERLDDECALVSDRLDGFRPVE